MNSKVLFFALGLLLVITSLVSANGGDLTGRDFVRLGELTTVTGVLDFIDGEWFLETDTLLYEVHLGDHDFRDNLGINLKPGMEATVTGFIYGNDVATVSVSLGETTYRFRTDEGIPLWAGINRARAIASLAAFDSSDNFGAEKDSDTNGFQPGVGSEEHALGGRFRAQDPDADQPAPGLGFGQYYTQQDIEEDVEE